MKTYLASGVPPFPSLYVTPDLTEPQTLPYRGAHMGRPVVRSEREEVLREGPPLITLIRYLLRPAREAISSSPKAGGCIPSSVTRAVTPQKGKRQPPMPPQPPSIIQRPGLGHLSLSSKIHAPCPTPCLAHPPPGRLKLQVPPLPCSEVSRVTPTARAGPTAFPPPWPGPAVGGLLAGRRK